MLIILKIGQNRKRIAFALGILENEVMRWRQGLMALSGVVALVAIVVAPSVLAAESSSSSYSVDRVFFVAGGELEACGAIYCAKQTAGEVAAGHTAGAAFRAQAGNNVEREPYLAFSVAGSSTDLGYLSPAGTAVAEATFAVKTYLANGYVVQLASDPPTNVENPSHQIDGLATPTTPQVGTEQFGINLTENSNVLCGSTVNVGSNPVQVPDNTFSFGTVDTDYDNCGQFKYVKGDTIASSSRSTGETDYTIAFIYNISDQTPDGEYVFSGQLVATSTF